MNQDWDPITIQRASKTSAKVVPRVSAEVRSNAKLAETEIPKPKQLSPESRTEMVQRRVAMGHNQVQLNNLCQFPLNTIRDIESGKAPPSPGQLNVLNRVLKSGLKYT